MSQQQLWGKQHAAHSTSTAGGCVITMTCVGNHLLLEVLLALCPVLVSCNTVSRPTSGDTWPGTQPSHSSTLTQGPAHAGKPAVRVHSTQPHKRQKNCTQKTTVQLLPLLVHANMGNC